MSVGTTPLTIHVPLSAPMSRRITKALDTLDTFLVMARSKWSQGTWSTAMPMRTQKAETTMSVTCEAPIRASLPKARMVNTSMTTRTTRGRRDNRAEGRRMGGLQEDIRRMGGSSVLDITAVTQGGGL